MTLSRYQPCGSSSCRKRYRKTISPFGRTYQVRTEQKKITLQKQKKTFQSKFAYHMAAPLAVGVGIYLLCLTLLEKPCFVFCSIENVIYPYVWLFYEGVFPLSYVYSVSFPFNFQSFIYICYAWVVSLFGIWCCASSSPMLLLWLLFCYFSLGPRLFIAYLLSSSLSNLASRRSSYKAHLPLHFEKILFLRATVIRASTAMTLCCDSALSMLFGRRISAVVKKSLSCVGLTAYSEGGFYMIRWLPIW